MDNGSCFTSRAMKSYLTSVGIVYEHSGAYHQHQNGPAELMWYRLTSLCIMQMMQSPWLGIPY
jgi:transposase InsO family protein